MSIKTNCSHVINDDDTITLYYDVTSTSNISYIYLESFGYSSSGQPIKELLEFHNLNKTTWSYSWTLKSHVVPWIQGGYQIKAQNIERNEEVRHGIWYQENNNSILNVWGAANNFNENVVLWGYGESDIENPIHYAKFEWTGFDSRGIVTSGEKILPTVFLAEPSVSVKIPCSANYKGTAKVTMFNGITSKTSSFDWCARSENDKNVGLTMQSFGVNNAGTIGIQNGKYVVGTKLLLEGKIKK